MTVARAEATFWSAYARNRNVDAGSAADGAVAVAGGYALCFGGTSLQYGVAVGSSRALREDDLQILSAFYGRRGLPARLELDVDVLERDGDLIAAGGYVEDGECLAVFEAPIGEARAPGGAVTVRTVGDRRQWTSLAVRALADVAGSEPHERILRSTRLYAAAAHALFVASVDGVDAGVGAAGIAGDVVTLFAAAVLPEFRRRGVHRALLDARLHFGVTRGAAHAAFKTAAGSFAERSALRAGFTRTSTRKQMLASGR